MSDLFFGVLTICISSIAFIFAFRFFRQGNQKIALTLLIFGGLVLRIYTSADFYLHSWDERYHALVSKNMMSDPFKPKLYENPVLPYAYQNWPANHIWLHKQPLPLWLMAGSMAVFGVNEIAIRIPSILFTTIGIWLTFFIGRFFYNRNVGFVATFFYAINGLIIELTAGRITTDHIDISFLFFIQLAIFFAILFAKSRNSVFNILAGISIGAAILSKWLPALIVLPVWLLVVYESGNYKMKDLLKHFSILLISCIVVFLPWQIYIHLSFPLEAAWESEYNFRHLWEAVESHSGPWYHYLDRIRINYGELIYIPIIWFFFKVSRDYTNPGKLALLIWFLVPLVFFSFVATKMQGYLLFTSPALFIISAAFFYMLYQYRDNHKFKWLFNIILILMVLMPFRYTLERVKPFAQRDRNPEWTSDLRALGNEPVEKGVLFNYSRPIEAMFYSDLTVYPQLPDVSTVSELQKAGYTILINNTGNIPIEITELKDIIFVQLRDPEQIK